MFRKVAFLEISPFNPPPLLSPLLTAVAGLQSTVCNATKNELLTKFVKGALELTEYFQEMISNEVLFSQLLYSPDNYSLQPCVLLKLLR